ncbi:MAG: VapC toxin family PIN domain ribonuclease [Rhizobiales bacterium 65-9]|nr:type II toxin-antitoxin system VapC family toxin [Hyphomicrobiales bacterium]OJY37211.1 MAG: VapC toxin family PIN domain ribonuclease [Rhizobiales bacterium 65-9]
MKFLLDTNVVSELSRPNADARLTAWASQLPEDKLFLSVITVAEVRRGIANLPPGKKRSDLDEWLRSGLLDRFRDRILGVTIGVAELWGLLAAHAKSKGIGFEVMDGFIAATAIEHDLVVATRNTRDFSALDLKFINPWLSVQSGRSS